MWLKNSKIIINKKSSYHPFLSPIIPLLGDHDHSYLFYFCDPFTDVLCIDTTF